MRLFDIPHGNPKSFYLITNLYKKKAASEMVMEGCHLRLGNKPYSAAVKERSRARQHLECEIK
jgi:hypothetical protein